MELKELRRSLADMLPVEAVNIAESVNPTGTGRAAIVPDPRISAKVYKGLVSSGNISKFDVEVQEKMHGFCGHGGRERFDKMRQQINGVIEAAEDFKRRNLRLAYFF